MKWKTVMLNASGPLIALLFMFFVALQPAALPQGPPVKVASPLVGAWVMTMFDKTDKFGHWNAVVQRKGAMPLGGTFSCSDPATIAREYAELRQAGVDYIVLDDTNTLYVDDKLIDKAVRAWFDFMDQQPPAQRLPIAIAAGGELNQHADVRMWQSAVDDLYRDYAGRPSYLRDNGKPVLFWYIEKDIAPQWTDPRWTIRKTFHFFRTLDEFRNGGWGYGADDLTRPSGLACASLQPGWDLSPPGSPRNNGELYCSRWSRALASRPVSILLSDWNGWNEGTALEESDSWRDSYGQAAPHWYLDLTRGYVQLFKYRKFLEGVYYRSEGSVDVYQFHNGQLEYQGAFPHGKPVVLVPPLYMPDFPPMR